MNKLEALVITGKLEVRFQGKEQLLNEVANLQKFIAENDFDNLAISFGRLSELTKDFTPNVSDYINSLYDFIFEVKEPLKREQELGLKEKLAMTLEELDVSLRTFNCLRRAGINTKYIDTMTMICLFSPFIDAAAIALIVFASTFYS